MASNLGDIFEKSLRTFLRPLVSFWEDPAVTGIFINSPEDIWIEKMGAFKQVDVIFSAEQLYQAIRHIAQLSGVLISEENPQLHTVLPDGSEISILLPPISKQGPVLALHKATSKERSVDELVQEGVLTPATEEFLLAALMAQQSMLIVGPPGSGKSTLLRALVECIPDHERLVCLGPSVSAPFRHPHMLNFALPETDLSHTPHIPTRDLVRALFLLRPHRLLVEGMGGGFALEMIQVLGAGYPGSLASIRACQPSHALRQIESQCLLESHFDSPPALRAQIASAFQLIVVCQRAPRGGQQVVEISECLPLDSQSGYQFLPLFQRRALKPPSKSKQWSPGALLPEGNIPSFWHRLQQLGFQSIDRAFFHPENYDEYGERIPGKDTPSDAEPGRKPTPVVPTTFVVPASAPVAPVVVSAAPVAAPITPVASVAPVASPQVQTTPTPKTKPAPAPKQDTPVPATAPSPSSDDEDEHSDLLNALLHAEDVSLLEERSGHSSALGATRAVPAPTRTKPAATPQQDNEDSFPFRSSPDESGPATPPQPLPAQQRAAQAPPAGNPQQLSPPAQSTPFQPMMQVHPQDNSFLGDEDDTMRQVRTAPENPPAPQHHISSTQSSFSSDLLSAVSAPDQDHSPFYQRTSQQASYSPTQNNLDSSQATPYESNSGLMGIFPPLEPLPSLESVSQHPHAQRATSSAAMNWEQPKTHPSSTMPTEQVPQTPHYPRHTGNIDDSSQILDVSDMIADELPNMVSEEEFRRAERELRQKSPVRRRDGSTDMHMPHASQSAPPTRSGMIPPDDLPTSNRSYLYTDEEPTQSGGNSGTPPGGAPTVSARSAVPAAPPTTAMRPPSTPHTPPRSVVVRRGRRTGMYDLSSFDVQETESTSIRGRPPTIPSMSRTPPPGSDVKTSPPPSVLPSSRSPVELPDNNIATDATVIRGRPTPPKK